MTKILTPKQVYDFDNLEKVLGVYIHDLNQQLLITQQKPPLLRQEAAVQYDGKIDSETIDLLRWYTQQYGWGGVGSCYIYAGEDDDDVVTDYDTVVSTKIYLLDIGTGLRGHHGPPGVAGHTGMKGDRGLQGKPGFTRLEAYSIRVMLIAWVFLIGKEFIYTYFPNLF